MKNKLLILSVLTLITSSCGNNQTREKHKNQIDDQNLIEINQSINSDFKTFEIAFDFWVTIGEEEDFEKFKTYTYFKLERNNEIVYHDNSLTEYEFGNSLFPIVLQTGENCFELLFEINNRPFKNYLKRLFVSNDKFVNQDKLPAFEDNPVDINNDGIKKYVGSFDDFEIWGENPHRTGYNPILYYSVTETGLKLDSLLTKQRNEIIYGHFYGFSYNNNIEQPINVLDKFYQEIKLITNGQ